MCGIVGLYNLPRAEPHLPAMLQRAAHRGPDAEGIWTAEGAGWRVALGHRRLSIIDLSDAANQPFVKDGLALTFNGEIYNYRALRDELHQTGVAFRTDSDTEVLLEAWRRWGVDSLTRLRGMFAFALLDTRSGELVLARDPFGIKPLHFARSDGGVAFASEIKSLLPVLPARDLDRQGLMALLVFGWAPDAFCVWRGVEKLAAGTVARFRPGQAPEIRPYYSLETLPERPETGVAALRDTLAGSVAAHMVADVPVATFLSGGLDSSLVSVLARREAGALDSYTIGFREEDRRLEAMPDDLRYARLLAKRFDIRLHEIEIAPDLAGLLPRLVDLMDEPVGEPAAINTLLICEAARKAGIKVMLSGMGADEIFGGYRKHQAAVLAQRYRMLPGWLRQGVVEPLGNALPVTLGGRGLLGARFAKRFLSFASLPEVEAFRRSYAFFGATEAKAAMRPDLLPLAENVFAAHDAIYAQAGEADAVNRMCHTDIRLFLPCLNLAFTDRASMAAGVEVRVPFVDPQVVADAMAIPGRRKIAGRERKAALKEAALAWLPREIVYRPKANFSAPLRAWVRRDLRGPIDDMVANGRLVRSGWLDAGWVRRQIDDDRSGAADRARELWHLLTVETWLAHHGLDPP